MTDHSMSIFAAFIFTFLATLFGLFIGYLVGYADGVRDGEAAAHRRRFGFKD
jgi:ABC-type dipeptide/oligopeptide/nickel transport system permease subunit